MNEATAAGKQALIFVLKTETGHALKSRTAEASRTSDPAVAELDNESSHCVTLVLHGFLERAERDRRGSYLHYIEYCARRYEPARGSLHSCALS